MWEDLKGILALVLVQFMFAGMFILFKITANDGTSLKVLVAYRLTFATLFMLPLALIFQRFPIFPYILIVIYAYFLILIII